MTDEEFQDENDKTSIDQLHKAVLQLSNNCFEIKKMCVTILVAAATLTATFTNRQLDTSIFVAGIIITGFFWILDSQSYYYQEKLRARMKELAEDMAGRRAVKLSISGVGMPLSEEREERTVTARVILSGFNESMFFYLALSVLLCALALLYHFGVIHSIPPRGPI